MKPQPYSTAEQGEADAIADFADGWVPDHYDEDDLRHHLDLTVCPFRAYSDAYVAKVFELRKQEDENDHQTTTF